MWNQTLSPEVVMQELLAAKEASPSWISGRLVTLTHVSPASVVFSR
ncbi:MAG: hypothetical protein LRY55_15350 [Leadbetterella sp.]|nr:hypothetical protein [Leadbetterella sp.]